METIKLRFMKPSGEPGEVSEYTYGIRADSLLAKFEQTGEIAAVRVNNEILPLSQELTINAVLEAVPLLSHEGMMIYRRSLAFLLAMSAKRSFPGKKLYIGHSLGNSYYYTFTSAQPSAAPSAAPAPQPVAARICGLSDRDLAELKQDMLALVAEDLPIEKKRMAYGEALELFKSNGQDDTALLLEQRNESAVAVNKCGTFTDIFVEPLVNRTGFLSAFDLEPYNDGFLLRFPAIGKGKNLEPFVNEPLIFSVYEEYKKWGRIVGVRSVGELNGMVSRRNIRDYIRIAEAFQERKLAEIAEKIYREKDRVRSVFIAGPSSSGKTTTAKRLSIELMVMGIKPVAISLDDYYRKNEEIPLDEEGKRDFERLEALDIPFLNSQLLELFEGKDVKLPVFDFKAGRRKEGEGQTVRMEKRRTMLIIEGIHGLNDALTPQVDPALKFKLYVSALTQLNLDDHNRIPTSDNRLLRRMVRDQQFRGKDAAWTIGMWASVQRGERQHIFPFQNSADAAFNSALDYELPVLKYYADSLLRAVKPGQREYGEAVRLLSFLENFASIPPQYVPGQSILREFIGDSEFKY
ncbi:MAG: nucleoside kinase [Treponema sp.]|jgi:uridine kinase|nr:nucleoside kinase [Treponema sp.]